MEIILHRKAFLCLCDTWGISSIHPHFASEIVAQDCLRCSFYGKDVCKNSFASTQRQACNCKCPIYDMLERLTFGILDQVDLKKDKTMVIIVMIKMEVVGRKVQPAHAAEIPKLYYSIILFLTFVREFLRKVTCWTSKISISLTSMTFAIIDVNCSSSNQSVRRVVTAN